MPQSGHVLMTSKMWGQFLFDRSLLSLRSPITLSSGRNFSSLPVHTIHIPFVLVSDSNLHRNDQLSPSMP